jgi:tungstate transport system substrate-binding protein
LHYRGNSVTHASINLVRRMLANFLGAKQHLHDPIDDGANTPPLTRATAHRLWRVAAIDPAKDGGGSWYRDIGGGMGAALNGAQAMGAYTISDRGTWLSFGNKGDLAVLVEGDPRLLNRCDVILLDPKRHPEAKQQPARRFALWLVSPGGQAAIGGYKVKGEQLFHPSADAPK